MRRPKAPPMRPRWSGCTRSCRWNRRAGSCIRRACVPRARRAASRPPPVAGSRRYSGPWPSSGPPKLAIAMRPSRSKLMPFGAPPASPRRTSAPGPSIIAAGAALVGKPYLAVRAHGHVLRPACAVAAGLASIHVDRSQHPLSPSALARRAPGARAITYRRCSGDANDATFHESLHCVDTSRPQGRFPAPQASLGHPKGRQARPAGPRRAPFGSPLAGGRSPEQYHRE